jgi:hypothetical protein
MTTDDTLKYIIDHDGKCHEECQGCYYKRSGFVYNGCLLVQEGMNMNRERGVYGGKIGRFIGAKHNQSLRLLDEIIE